MFTNSNLTPAPSTTTIIMETQTQMPASAEEGRFSLYEGGKTSTTTIKLWHVVLFVSLFVILMTGGVIWVLTRNKGKPGEPNKVEIEELDVVENL